MTTTATDTSADTFAERVFEAALGAIDVWAMFFGDKFGSYEALAENGALTRSELATRTGMHSRYTHE